MKILGFIFITVGVIWNHEIGQFEGWNLLWLALSWMVIWCGVFMYGALNSQKE